MRRYFVAIGIILGALFIGCGGEDAPEAPADPVAAPAEPAATVDAAPTAQPSATAVQTSAAAPRPSPTSFAGGIPSPAVVSAAATEVPTPAPTSTTVPAPVTQPSTPTPTASAVAASPTLTPERTDEPDDCGDFATHRDAQLYFLEQGGPLDDPFGLDTDDDIASNAETDTGYDRRSYRLFGEYTPTPTQTATPTPTIPPASHSTDIWSNPERTAELNAIDWQAFEDGIEVSLINEGRRIRTFWRTPNGEIDGELEWIDVECGPRFGNRLDEANPSFRFYGGDPVTIWIEPADGGAPFCAKVDRFRDWLPTDQPPPPRLSITDNGERT